MPIVKYCSAIFKHILIASARLVTLSACLVYFGVGSTAAAEVVNAVEVRGAQFIPEDDIRMTCGAESGVEYLDLELLAIEDCLMSTGVFEAVAVSQEGTKLIIDVAELDTRPGRIDVSLAYASDQGAVASLAFERYNLFKDTYGASKLDFSKDGKRLSANLYRTGVLGSSLDLGFEFIGGKEKLEDRSYTEKSVRAETYLAWTPSPRTRIEGGVGYRKYSMYDLDPGASSLLIREQTNGVEAPFLRLGVQYQSKSEAESVHWRDFEYSFRLDQYHWNIGTSNALLDTRAEGRLKFQLAEKTSLMFGLEAGITSGLEKNSTRAIDRYFIGGDTLRGFAPRGIGPRDGDDMLGGNKYVAVSLEVQRSLADLFKTPVRGGVFVDAGSNWDLNDTLGGAIDDRWHLRASLGLSLTFDIQSTPVSIYLARPFRSEPGDKHQVFGLTLSSVF